MKILLILLAIIVIGIAREVKFLQNEKKLIPPTYK